MDKVDEMGCAGLAGFQVPLGIRKRKRAVDEMIELNELDLTEVVAFMSCLDEATAMDVEKKLDDAKYVEIAEMIRTGFEESALRSMVGKKIREIVRKKEGGGGYVLYAPNPGGKSEPKKVGEFPTKLGAKRAELARFPPKDQPKLKRQRDYVAKLTKDPKKAAEKEKQWLAAPTKKKTKKKNAPRRVKREMFELDRLTESLFKEERAPSEWEDFVSKLSKQAVLADKGFQRYQQAIEKRSEALLKGALSIIDKELSTGFKMKVGEISKKDDGTMTAQFGVVDEEGTTEVGPFTLTIAKSGVPDLSMSDSARSSITKLDPGRGKLLRADLVSAQEDKLKSMDDVASLIEKRDAYLQKLESKLDGFVSGLSPIEISILKKLLVEKYRKLS